MARERRKGIIFPKAQGRGQSWKKAVADCSSLLSFPQMWYRKNWRKMHPSFGKNQEPTEMPSMNEATKAPEATG